MTRLAILTACAALAACGHTPEPEVIIRTVEVSVPVRTPCIDPADLPPERQYTDERIREAVLSGEIEEPSDYGAVFAIGEGLEERNEDLPVLWRLVRSCVR